MKNYPSYFLLSALALTGCQQNCYQDGVVCETYVHRYGVELDPQDWSQRGQHGQVISTYKDGVVISKTYDSGILHGDTTYSFPHQDAIQRRQQFDQGHLRQEILYYPSGLPRQQISYETENTQWVLNWYESGAPQSKEEYENQFLVRAEYFDPSHQLESRVEEGSGKRTVFDEYGHVQAVDSIENGVMVSKTTYHPNGVPAAVTPYQNGVVSGIRRTYNKGGEPATVETWCNNCQHGNTEVYAYGHKIADVPYVNGFMQGVERRYSNNQNLVEENTWVKGAKHGPCTTYVNGQKTQTAWYFQNNPVNKATFDVMSRQ